MNSLCLQSWVALVVKNLPANAGDIRDSSSTPGSARSSGGGHGNPLQYSYLENPMDRGAWQATVHRVAKSWTQLKPLSTHEFLFTSQTHVCSHLLPLLATFHVEESLSAWAPGEQSNPHPCNIQSTYNMRDT